MDPHFEPRNTLLPHLRPYLHIILTSPALHPHITGQQYVLYAGDVLAPKIFASWTPHVEYSTGPIPWIEGVPRLLDLTFFSTPITRGDGQSDGVHCYLETRMEVVRGWAAATDERGFAGEDNDNGGEELDADEAEKAAEERRKWKGKGRAVQIEDEDEEGEMEKKWEWEQEREERGLTEWKVEKFYIRCCVQQLIDRASEEVSAEVFPRVPGAVPDWIDVKDAVRGILNGWD